MKSIYYFMLLFFIVIGCKKNDEATVDNLAIAESADVSLSQNVMTAKMPQKETNDAPKIIKNANLRFETDNLQNSFDVISKLIKDQNGLIQNDTEGKDQTTIYRNISIRLPNNQFDAFIKTISKGVIYFDRKEITSDDVSAAYIDIEARLNAKKILENRYFELLKKATKVSEMIEIETQLSAIREEIDAKEGQLKYMKNQVSMSTINIECYKNIAKEDGITVSFGSKIWNAIKTGANGFSSFLIQMLQVWPFIAIFVAVIVFIKKRRKLPKS